MPGSIILVATAVVYSAYGLAFAGWYAARVYIKCTQSNPPKPPRGYERLESSEYI